MLKKILFNENLSTEAIVHINTIVINAEIADTPEKQYQGLSKRESLERGRGMLFIINEYGRPTFVMRDMKFSIDIIWIRDTMVVGISKNLPLPISDEPLIQYFPNSEINRVLEVPAGFTDRNNIKIGDSFKIFMPKT